MRINYILILVIAVCFSACKKKDFIYKGDSYIQFSDNTRNIELTSNELSYSFKIHSVAKNTKTMNTMVYVDEAKTDIEEGKHFVISKKTVEIKPGEYISEFNIDFIYKSFIVGQNAKILLKLSEGNTKIGTRDSLLITIKQQDWIQNIAGEYEVSYTAKGKQQSSKAEIISVAKLNSDESDNRYKIVMKGLPVWTFSSGPKIYPEEFELTFTDYQFSDKELSYTDKILATPDDYKSWFSTFNYGDISIQKQDGNIYNPATNSLTLNYKIILGANEAMFNNVTLKKIIKVTEE